MTASSLPGASARRERQLAGDGRAGSYARGKARRSQYAYVARTWRTLALIALPLAGLIGVSAVFIAPGFLRGAFVGGAGVAVAGLLAFWVVQATGTAPTMMGDLAEQWTARELRRLRRDGWKLVNHFKLRVADIDHVVIGPGGVLAVQTKWSATAWDLNGPRVREAAGRWPGTPGTFACGLA